jgi:hypothetical protein
MRMRRARKVLPREESTPERFSPWAARGPSGKLRSFSSTTRASLPRPSFDGTPSPWTHFYGDSRTQHTRDFVVFTATSRFAPWNARKPFRPEAFELSSAACASSREDSQGHFISPLVTLALSSREDGAAKPGYRSFIAATNSVELLAFGVSSSYALM